MHRLNRPVCSGAAGAPVPGLPHKLFQIPRLFSTRGQLRLELSQSVLLLRLVPRPRLVRLLRLLPFLRRPLALLRQTRTATSARRFGRWSRLARVRGCRPPACAPRSFRCLLSHSLGESNTEFQNDFPVCGMQIYETCCSVENITFAAATTLYILLIAENYNLLTRVLLPSPAFWVRPERLAVTDCS